MGFEIKPADDSCFEISPGIVKIDNELHISPQKIFLEQKEENQYVYLSVQKRGLPDGSDVSKGCSQTMQPDDNAFELFRYTRNAKMFEYKDISEVFNKPINRINQIFCKYGVAGGSTLHPYYLRLFAEGILECSGASASDIAFSYQCLNGISSIDVIRKYFGNVSSNSDIVSEMKKILAGLRTNAPVKDVQPEKASTPGKVTVW